VTVIESLLWPASVLYGTVASLRARAYRKGLFRQKRLAGIVVSVGNVTTGGTGKTPMVVWLGQRFAESGKKVGVLSRGYRPLPVSSGVRGNAQDMRGWNDEVALLHNRLGDQVELGTGARRFEKGRELEWRGVSCFILDDGFQHLQLARDVDIVMIDATKPFGGGHVLPSGRLREPISALRRADVVVIHRTPERVPAIEAVIRRHSGAPMFFSQTKLLGLEKYRETERSAVPARDGRFFAFSGIGNPSAFLADLKKWGVEAAGSESFRDHYHYTQEDINRLESKARAIGADALICTEKDIYDLPAGLATRMPMVFCRIGLQFNDEEALWQAIVRVIENKRPGKVG
jgi:tetraacyldisaccharide 4'-kinase